MSTGTIETTTTTEPIFTVEFDTLRGGYFILRDGRELTNATGEVRYFSTRNSATKRISRERRGEFHR